MERNKKLTACLLVQAFGAGIACGGLVMHDFQLGVLGGNIIAIGLGAYFGFKYDLEQGR